MKRAWLSFVLVLTFAPSLACDDSRRSKSDAEAVSGDAGTVALVDGIYSAGMVWRPMSSGQYVGGLWGGQALTFDPPGALLGLANSGLLQLETSEAPAEFGADGVVAWGRWASGTATSWGIMQVTAPMLATNYIAGVQSPSQEVLHASYSAFASIAPTAITGSTANSVAVGVSNSVTGTVSVSNGTVTVALENIAVSGRTFALTASAGLYAATGLLAGGQVMSSDGGCPCSARAMSAGAAQGWFFGANGERAGLNFAFSSALGDVSGAVVFK